MSNTGRWVLAMVLLLLVGFATQGFVDSLHDAPPGRVTGAFHVQAMSLRPAPATVEAAFVPPPSEAPREASAPPAPSARTACAPKLHFVPLRGCVPDTAEEGRRLAAVVYPDRAAKALPPLPPPDDEIDMATADRRMEQLYAERDYDAALTVALSACKRGDAFACALAGNMQTRGEGKVEKVPVAERGAQLLAKSCKMGDTWGCTRTMALSGR
jgi:hypothetical protein